MNVKFLSPRCQRLPKSPPPTLCFRGASQRLRKSEPHEPPLDMFGADAVERWFTEKEVKEILTLATRLMVS
jgi:hypothetical protein